MKTYLIITLSLFFATGCMKGKQNYFTGKYTGPRAEVAMQYAIEEYGREVAELNGMQFLIAGDTTDDKNIRYCLTMRCDQKMRLENGRHFACYLVKDFHGMLANCPEVAKYNALKQKKDPLFPNEAPIQNVGYKIMFWNADDERIQKPYLAQILFSNSTFYYYRQDRKTGKLELIYKEAYADCLHNFTKK